MCLHAEYFVLSCQKKITTIMSSSIPANTSYEQNLHRRIQQRIAGQYLDHIDPDRTLANEVHQTQQEKFRGVDPDLKKKFDEQHKQFQKSESAYSIQNVCWLIGAIGVFYYSDFWPAVLYDPRIHRFWFNLGAILVSVNIGIAGFLIVWLTYVKKISSDEWEKHYPAAIPLATASFILGGIFLTMGLWPVWGPLTPVILFVMFMGFVVTVAMLPNF